MNKMKMIQAWNAVTQYVAAAEDMAGVLELIAAEADNGWIMIPSALRLTIDAALIKAGRKAAPVREGE